MAATTKEQKVQLKDTLKEDLSSARVAIVADYRGTKVNDMVVLRKELSKINASALVCKNTLARLAFSELEYSVPEDYLIGPSIIIISQDDAVKTSKVLVDFAKSSETFVIKGGLLQQDAIGADEIKTLAKLPSREELMAKVIYMLKSPMSRFAASLANPIQGLNLTLKAIQEKNQEE